MSRVYRDRVAASAHSRGRSSRIEGPNPREVCSHWAHLNSAVDPDLETKRNLHLDGEQESNPNEVAAACRNACL